MPNYIIAMKFTNTLKIFLSAALFALLFLTSCNKKTDYKTMDGFTEGTTYHIVYSHSGGDTLNSLVEELLTKVDNSMSVYNKESIISKLNRNEEVTIDTLFINVFNRSREFYDISGGSFDISAAPLFDIWGFGAKERKEVTQQMVDSVREFIGMDKVKLENGILKKSDPRVTLNMNAIAKGYTSDVVAEAFDRRGIKNYLIEIGGEIFCRGVNPKGKEWSVAIDKPIEGNMIQGEQVQDILSLSNRGLATSGNYRKFFKENGKTYSHTIDPKTGFPARQSLLSATIIAKDAMTADAYATYFMVVGLDKAKEILAADPDIDGYLVYSENGEFRVFSTPGVEIRKNTNK